MAYDIGPKIGIDGEAEFRKQINQINTSIKTLGTEMQAVTSAFIGQEKSSQALTAQNAVLAKTVGDLESKLVLQKKMLTESAAAYGTADERTQKWQQAVNKTTTELNKANAQIAANNAALASSGDAAQSTAAQHQNAMGKIGDAAKTALSASGSAASGMVSATQGALEGMASAGGAALQGIASASLDALKGLASAAVSAVKSAASAIGNFARESVEAGAAFDGAMSQVAAVSGAAGAEFDSLRAKAMEMGAKTKFSATESAEAFNYMAMAGWKTKDMLDGIEGIMSLATASGEDLATTSDIVTDALTAFGLSASDSGHFANVLAVASSNANTNVSMMGETFKYVAPVAGALGYSVDDTAAAIGLMASSGIKATQAGTALRSIISRLSTDAGASSKKLGALGTLTQELGVQFYNADGSARALNDVIMDSRAAWAGLSEEQQISYAKTIAGQEAMSGWLALMNAAPADVDKLTQAISESDGAAAAMAATMQNNLTGDITLFQSALESAKIVLSDQLTPALRGFVQFGTEGLSQVTQAFQEGGLRGALDAFGQIVTSGLAQVTERLPEAAEAGMQLLSTLAGGIVENLPAVTDAAGEIIGMLISGVQTAIPQIAEQAPTVIGEFTAGVTGALPQVFSVGGEILGQLNAGILTVLPELANSATTIVSTLAEQLGQALPTLIPSAVDMVLTLVEGLTGNTDKLVGSAADLVTGLALGIISALPILAEKGPVIIGNLVTGIISAVPKLVQAADEIMWNLWLFLEKSLTGLAGNIVGIGKGVVGWLKDGMLKALNILGDFASRLLGGLRESIANAWNDFIEEGKRILGVIWDGIVQGMPVMAAIGIEVLKALNQGIQSVREKILGIGSDIVSGIWSGISGAASWLKEKVTGFFGGIVDGVKGFLGIHSPSTVFAGIGENMAAGLGKGWDNEIADIRRNVENSLDFGSMSLKAPNMTMAGITLGRERPNYQEMLAGVVNGMQTATAGTNLPQSATIILQAGDGMTLARWILPDLRSAMRDDPEPA